MSLHLINAQPDSLARYRQCFDMLSEGDVILLIEDAVYAALPAYADRFVGLPADVQLCLLSPDATARGVSQLNPAFSLINDADFVRLSCEHSRVVSW